MPQFVYDRVERDWSGRFVLRTTRLPAPAMHLSLPPHLPCASVPERSLPPLHPGLLQAEVEQLWSRVVAPAAPYELRRAAAHGLASKLCAIAPVADDVAIMEGTLRRCGSLTTPLLRLAREAEQQADLLTLQVVLSCFANFSFAGLASQLVAGPLDRLPLGMLLVGALRAAEEDRTMRQYVLPAVYNLSSEGGVVDVLDAGGADPLLRNFARHGNDAELKKFARHTLLNLRRRRSLVRAVGNASRPRRGLLSCCGLFGAGPLFKEIELDLEPEPDESTPPDENYNSSIGGSGSSSSKSATASVVHPTSATRDKPAIIAGCVSVTRATSAATDDACGAAPSVTPAEAVPADRASAEGDVDMALAAAVAVPTRAGDTDKITEAGEAERQATCQRIFTNMAAARESLTVNLDEELAEEETRMIQRLAAARSAALRLP